MAYITPLPIHPSVPLSILTLDLQHIVSCLLAAVVGSHAGVDAGILRAHSWQCQHIPLHPGTCRQLPLQLWHSGEGSAPTSSPYNPCHSHPPPLHCTLLQVISGTGKPDAKHGKTAADPRDTSFTSGCPVIRGAAGDARRCHHPAVTLCAPPPPCPRAHLARGG